MCRCHEIHSPTHSTVWRVGLLPPCAALRLNQEQICKTDPGKMVCLEDWLRAGESLVSSSNSLFS